MGFGRYKDQSGLVGPFGQVAVHRVVAQVGLATDEPFGKWGIAVVTYLLRLDFPVHPFGLLGPKSIAVMDRACVKISKIAHENLLFTSQFKAYER
jgi:hypothetical protein